MKNNWSEKKLTDICEFIGGSQPPKSYFSKTKKTNHVRLIQIRDYKSDNHIVYIPTEKARKFCDKNDVMIGRYGPPLFQILRGLEGAYNVALIKAIPQKKYITNDYLFLFLKYSEIQDYIVNLSQRAAGQTGVNKRALESYPISIPPLLEQQRIVEILDKAFSAIDAAKENLERNLRNAREIFDSYLHSIFTYQSDNWQQKLLGEIIKLEYGKPLPDFKRKSDGIYPVYGANGIKDRTDEYYHDQDSIIVGRKGSAGEINLTESKFWPLDVTYFITLNHNEYSLNFIYYLLRHLKLPKLAKGVKPGINRNEVYAIPIKIPTLHKQKQIVNGLKLLWIEAQNLENIYQQKLIHLQELKKSLLQKAFNGELT